MSRKNYYEKNEKNKIELMKAKFNDEQMSTEMMNDVISVISS